MRITMPSFDLMDLPIAVYLSNFRCYYPGILEWYSGLKDELLSGRRSVFVSRKGSEVQGLAITKNGSRAKLCHISVSPTARDRGLGGTLMHLALSDMKRRGAKEIHVTTGEEVFRDHAEFFRLSGFRLVDWRLSRYRRGTSELIWKLAVKSEPRGSEQIALDDLEPPREFYGEANYFSSHIRQFTALRRKFEPWLSNHTPSKPNESLSICDASLSCPTWASLNLRPLLLEPTWRLSALGPGNDNGSMGLPDLFRPTDSCMQSALSLVAKARATQPELYDDFWNCHRTWGVSERNKVWTCSVPHYTVSRILEDL